MFPKAFLWKHTVNLPLFEQPNLILLEVNWETEA